MKRATVLFCLAVIGTCILAETASARILGRRWERRKAQIRWEVTSQVTAELTAKMESDLAEKMAVARRQLQQAAEEQVAAESQKLSEYIKTELAKLQKRLGDVDQLRLEKQQECILWQQIVRLCTEYNRITVKAE